MSHNSCKLFSLVPTLVQELLVSSVCSIRNFLLAKFSFVENWAIPEKKQTGGIEDILFWNTPGNVRFMNLLLEVLKKTSFHLWKFCKIVWHPLEISSSNQKPRPMEIRHPASVFFEYPRKFVFFTNLCLGLPNAIYFNTPRNSIIDGANL